MRMREGKALYLEQADNLSGMATYRMHMAEVSADRLVFDLEECQCHALFFVTLGEIQPIYFLDREIGWRLALYSMVRTGRNASRLATGT